MKRFGLIGDPIGRSLSPALFRAAYDGKYAYELIQGEVFEESYQIFLNGYDGINVTAPFKELAYEKADIISEECRLAKATNLLVKTPEGVKAYNSDMLGVRMWLQEVLDHISGDIPVAKRTPPTSWTPPPAARGVARFSPTGISPGNRTKEQNGPVTLIVGCGGAGKAAAAAAVSLGQKVILMNRNQDRAEKLAEHLRAIGHYAETRPLSDFCRSFKEADIVIYSIPTRIDEIKDLTDNDFAPEKPKYTMEANYKNPSFDEEFIKRMTFANPMAHHSDGRIWLLYQAVTGYEIFTDEKPDLEKMSSIL